MPSTYAHYKFGQEIYKRLPESIKRSVDISPELFAIGQHGPDIFFYHSALTKNPVKEMGFAMHSKSSMEFFAPAIEKLKNINDESGYRAYIYGFVGHFILDSVCHWYVEDAIEETGVPHTWIEGDFDRMLMIRDGLDPVKYMTACHIVPSEENAKVISEFFPDITQEDANKSLKDMVFYSKLLRCANPFKRAFVLGGIKVMGASEFLSGMVIRKKANGKCKDAVKNLDRLFSKALDEAVKYLAEFEAAIETDAPLSDRFSRTFGPDKESKEEYEVYKA